MSEQISFVEEEVDWFAGYRRLKIKASYQKHSITSKAAARKVIPDLNKLQRRVFYYLEECRFQGSTDKEGYTTLDMPQNTYRPRRIELWQKRYVFYTEVTREGCTVWKAREFVTSADREADRQYREKKKQ